MACLRQPTDAGDQWPGYDRGIARREFDQVAAWSVDRLDRSFQELVAFLGDLHAKGVGRPVSTAVVERIRERFATGRGIFRVAKALGVGTGTVHRIKREMAAVTA
jgi:DNA invertase Pin-like site-specific DNA recombinase